MLDSTRLGMDPPRLDSTNAFRVTLSAHRKDRCGNGTRLPVDQLSKALRKVGFGLIPSRLAAGAVHFSLNFLTSVLKDKGGLARRRLNQGFIW